jgi:hypothetical protein
VERGGRGECKEGKQERVRGIGRDAEGLEIDREGEGRCRSLLTHPWDEEKK